MALNIVVSHLLPPSSIKLGRFITNISYPNHDGYHDPNFEPPSPVVTRRNSYRGRHHDGYSATFTSVLMSLLSAGFSKRARTQTEITAEKVETYMLDDTDKWFTEAMSLDATREWVERAIDRGVDIYMIVGYHALTNAHIACDNGQNTDIQGRLAMSFATTAVGIDSALGSTLGPSLGIGSEHSRGLVSDFKVQGEHICAFQYRKIRHRFLSSSRLDTSRLSKSPRWSSVERGRGEEDGEDDVVEVEAVLVDDLDGQWGQQQVDGDTLCIKLEEWI